MPKRVYDVIVVGCGPGGAIAGRASALSGAKTLVIEKKKDIGIPIHCAEWISSIRLLEETLGFKIDPRGILSEIKGITFFSSQGASTPMLPTPEATAVDRRIFDKSLAREAARCGADLRVDTALVNIIKDNGWVRGVVVRSRGRLIEIGSSIVIGADGVNSQVARLSGLRLPRRLDSAMGYEFVNVGGLNPPVFECYWGSQYAPGKFAYIVPKEKDTANVAVMVDLGVMKERKSFTQLFRRFTEHPEVAKKLKKASPTALVSGSATSHREPGEKIVANNVMLVGDAGRRPVIGGEIPCSGMMTAMLGGNIAGQVAAEMLNKGDLSERGLKKYADKLEETIGRERSWLAEGSRLFRELESLDDHTQDRAIRELGIEIPRLFYYIRGALPFKDSLEKVMVWLKELRRHADNNY